MKITALSSIEALEARIAPAATIIHGGLGATFVDADGDLVTVKVSSGTLTPGNFTFTATPLGEQLQTLDLSGGAVAGADLTFSVKKSATGDGLVSVGHLNSGGHDLGRVTIKGNLDQLHAGDATTSDGSVKILTAKSLGKYALSSSTLTFTGRLGSLTVAGDMREVSVFVMGGGGVSDARLGSVKIGGSLIGGAGDFSGSILAQGSIGAVKIGKDAIAGAGGQSAFIRSLSGNIASVSIGGSLIGGNGNSSGSIEALSIGPVSIKGDMIGKDGLGSGTISSDSTAGSIASVTIGGSLIGGDGPGGATGQISSAATIGPVKIGGDVRGGAGGGGLSFFSGCITASRMTSLTIGGSLIGGSGDGSGAVFSGTDIGKIKIGKNIIGGSGENSGRLDFRDMQATTIGGSVIGGSANNTGQIIASGNIPSLTIKGSLIGGSIVANDITNVSLDRSGYIQARTFGAITFGGSIISGVDKALLGTLTNSGSINAVLEIASLTVKGSLIGNSSAKGDSPVVITASGDVTTHMAIGKLTVGGYVHRANILGGFGDATFAFDGDAQIGAVTVGGDWIASTLSAGVRNLGADDAAGGTGANADNVNFGDAHDAPIAGNTGLGSIKSIQIKGLVIGSAIAGDHFGFLSHKIGLIKAPGFKPPTLVVNAELSPVTGDVSVHIV